MNTVKQTCCICCCIKNEHDFINRWLEYHIKIGISHFYLLVDNVYDEQEPYIIDKKFKDKEVIGIDLHEFKPYTIVGDIHNLQFEDNYFDIEFTNIFDHSIYPEKFISEVHRTLKSGGIFILHFQYKIDQDKYTETIITDVDKFKALLKDKFEIISDNKLPSNITAMNYEIKLKKKLIN